MFLKLSITSVVTFLPVTSHFSKLCSNTRRMASVSEFSSGSMLATGMAKLQGKYL